MKSSELDAAIRSWVDGVRRDLGESGEGLALFAPLAGDRPDYDAVWWKLLDTGADDITPQVYRIASLKCAAASSAVQEAERAAMLEEADGIARGLLEKYRPPGGGPYPV
ncbi:hypothetical protein IBTHAUMO2_590102 [Nitrosopumilaceae archaeon]|nr:hypothetical protein [Nitrosopumilus sp.]CAI9832161.1 hypothetical protein IBTHAUMO2_590102 [Nitrosopumilaceae archaeon]MDA7945362.1 hypothetical protein [Nitrosopumilus sp.]MDA7954941.1 hypothetical protein [Nitrosopumilus sp.]MDA7973973.1 hypothetical protein [Nitrosopumilus sp.]